MAEPVPPLLVYPALWQRSREQFPHDWQWPDQLRCLCALARDYRRKHRAAYCRLPDGERLFLQSLDQVDVEDFVAMLKNDFPGEKNPMLRVAPDDENPYLDPQYAPTMNGHKVKFDA